MMAGCSSVCAASRLSTMTSLYPEFADESADDLGIASSLGSVIEFRAECQGATIIWRANLKPPTRDPGTRAWFWPGTTSRPPWARWIATDPSNADAGRREE
jgi:hypothetical protein